LQALAGDLVAVQLQQQPGEAGEGGDLHLGVVIGEHQLEYGFAQGILDGGGQIGEAAAGELLGGRMGGGGPLLLLAEGLLAAQVVPALEAGVGQPVGNPSFPFPVSRFQPDLSNPRFRFPVSRFQLGIPGNGRSRSRLGGIGMTKRQSAALSGKQFLHFCGNFVPFFPACRVVFDLDPGLASDAGGADALQHGRRQTVE
jgi:hypothetical protein